MNKNFQMDKKRLTSSYPPEWIYDECVRRFGIDFPKGTIFTYGENIHAYNMNISDDLYVHELTHVYQQKNHPDGPDGWWHDYLNDGEFRLKEEIEAYRNQWEYAMENCNSQYRKVLRKHIIDCLSGKMYGRLMTRTEVKNSAVFA